jgi:hypothetical protein
MLHADKKASEIMALSDEEAIAPLLALPKDELDTTVRPYLITRRYVYNSWMDYGAGDPRWMGRVRGRFPGSAEGQLIDLSWIERALAPVALSGDSGMTLRAGIDVAGPGEDETVLCIRDGGRIVKLRGWADKDARGACLAALKPYAERLEQVNIDSIGIGHYFYVHIRDAFKLLNPKTKVVAVNVGERSTGVFNQEHFPNTKAQYYWALRKWFEEGRVSGLGGHTDGNATGKIRAQLTTIRYDHDERGRTKIESKDDLSRRGVKSPDYAEALMLAFAEARAGVYVA